MSCLLSIPCMYGIYSTLQLSCRIETIGRSSECMYAPIYSQVGILLLIRGRGREGAGSSRSVRGDVFQPEEPNLSSGQHSRARRVRMEGNGRGRGVEVAVCIYGAVVWELL